MAVVCAWDSLTSRDDRFRYKLKPNITLLWPLFHVNFLLSNADFILFIMCLVSVKTLTYHLPVNWELERLVQMGEGTRKHM